jgi:hypothetical protein
MVCIRLELNTADNSICLAIPFAFGVAYPSVSNTKHSFLDMERSKYVYRFKCRRCQKRN